MKRGIFLLLGLPVLIAAGSLHGASNGWYRDVVWCGVDSTVALRAQTWAVLKGADESTTMERIAARSFDALPALQGPCEAGSNAYEWRQREDGAAALLTQPASGIRVLIRFATKRIEMVPAEIAGSRLPVAAISPGLPVPVRKTVWVGDEEIDDVDYLWKDGTLVRTVSKRHGVRWMGDAKEEGKSWSRRAFILWIDFRNLVLGLLHG